MYSLKIKKSAQKELDSLPDKVFLKIDEGILTLKENPYPFPQSKKLKGEEKRRLRVGDYRVVYSVDEKNQTVTVSKIRHRRDVYRS